MSGVQDPLDDVFVKADKIYEWINQIGNGNKNQGRTGKPHRYQNKPKQHQKVVYDRDDQRQYYSQTQTQDDLFD
jgi:hypothetical protein